MPVATRYPSLETSECVLGIVLGGRAGGRVVHLANSSKLSGNSRKVTAHTSSTLCNAVCHGQRVGKEKHLPWPRSDRRTTVCCSRVYRRNQRLVLGSLSHNTYSFLCRQHKHKGICGIKLTPSSKGPTGSPRKTTVQREPNCRTNTYATLEDRPTNRSLRRGMKGSRRG